MSRSFERRRAFDLAATLLVIILAVSVGDIDDYYNVNSHAMRSPMKTSMSSNAMVDISSATSDSESESEHACACLLCVLTLPDSFGARLLRPSAGKLSTPIVAGIADTRHLPEVYHPPSA